MVSIIIGIAVGAIFLGIVCYILFSALMPIIFVGKAAHMVYREVRYGESAHDSDTEAAQRLVNDQRDVWTVPEATKES